MFELQTGNIILNACFKMLVVYLRLTIIAFASKDSKRCEIFCFPKQRRNRYCIYIYDIVNMFGVGLQEKNKEREPFC